MELHSCRNCELITQILEKKLQTFDILTQENISLHNNLIRARDEIVTLQAQITDLNKVIFAEREQNLQQYIKAQNDKPRSDVLMTVVSGDSHELQKYIISKKTKSNLPPVPDVSVNTNTLLMNLFDDQREMYQENLTLLQTLNCKYVKQLERQLQQAQEHASILVGMYTVYRRQFFTQKKENCKDHKKFLSFADMLTKANNKYVLELEHNLLEVTKRSVNEEARGILNSLLREIDRRDKLVSMLRQQQSKLSLQIEELKKDLSEQQRIYNESNLKLKEQLKKEKEKYSYLEQRRTLDFEGFCTDIKQCKKEVLKMKREVSSKAKLIEKIDRTLKANKF